MHLRYIGEHGAACVWVYASDQEQKDSKKGIKPKQEISKEAITEYLKWLDVQLDRALVLLKDECCKNPHEMTMVLKLAGYKKALTA